MSNQSGNDHRKQGLSSLGSRVTGAGLAELEVPGWARSASIFLRLGIFFCVACAGLLVIVAAAGWQWIEKGFSGWNAWLGLVVTAIAALCAVFAGRRFDSNFLNLRVTQGRRVFGGLRSGNEAVAIWLALLVVTGAAMAAALQLWSSFPLPRALSVVSVQVTAPVQGAESRPLYLWDYATWVDPAIFDKVSIIVPYEKGPPQKLLSKVYFEDDATGSVILELHGKRPRFYSQQEVSRVFEHGAADPRTWPALWRLLREAGFSQAGARGLIPEFSLIRLVRPDGTSTTQAVGVPWATSAASASPASTPAAEATETAAAPGASPNLSGRFFFWGPGGSVFQVHCPGPCAMSRLLELVEFAPDPKGSLRERVLWTQKALRQLLATRPAPEARRRHEGLLSLYLVSLLTLDPRDPEAFFHLGKLAHNRETLESAIRYGRDLGLEAAKIAELQAGASRLSR